MKKKLLLLAGLCLTGLVSAQEGQNIGIGTVLPDASAILHVDSDHKGVLIPNVILTDLNSKDPITSDAKESLLVYNKQEKKDVTSGKVEIAKGYYYWVVTNATTGKWVRVLTTEDSSEILSGQVQEYFVEEQKEIDVYKLDAKGKIEIDKDTKKPLTEKKMVGGFYVYAPDKNNPQAGRIELNIPTLVRETQSLTSLSVSQFDLYHYLDGTKSRTELSDAESVDIGNPWTNTSQEIELVYVDEKGVVNNYAVRDLLGADNQVVPAITNLTVNHDNTGLIYINDKGKEVPVSLEVVVKNLEAKTKLEINSNDELIYINENGSAQSYSFPLRSIVKEPWYNAETGKESISNGENIFVNGWVGIGLTAQEAKKAITERNSQTTKFPDEMLRVNGSIYARNSYYADYVFENYFTKENSSLKYDYNFKDLSTVESFIKTNYHLPGITPVAELEKSKDDGYLINVSELSIQLLEKVEELYLHTIDQQKLIDQQKAQLLRQEERLQQIESMLKMGEK